jgi:hypothetical protein
MSGYLRYYEGILIEEFIDNNDGTGTINRYNQDGSIDETEELSGLVIQPEFVPLDSVGALATLLVVLNLIPLEDAANVIHEQPEHLIAEALAWSLGA